MRKGKRERESERAREREGERGKEREREGRRETKGWKEGTEIDLIIIQHA